MTLHKIPKLIEGQIHDVDAMIEIPVKDVWGFELKFQVAELLRYQTSENGLSEVK